MNSARITAAAVLATIASAAAQTAVDSLPAGTIAAIEDRVVTAMGEQRVPGLSVAVGLDGEVMWTRGFGFADVENAVPATADTVYRLASISKPITATLAMQLVDEQRLDLDAPVQRYLPDFPVKPWPLTVHELLGHLGGIRHYRDHDEIASARHYARVADALEAFAADPLLCEPGTEFHYSTYGFNLIGAVVVAASGESYAALLQERVCAPAGMVATRLDDCGALVPHRAQGYHLVQGKLQNSIPVDTSNKVPGGGLCGTAADLVRFGNALLAGMLVSPATRERMWTSMQTRDGKETHYGFGWSVRSDAGDRVVGHSGGQPRVSTMLTLLPDDGVVVALMCNLEGVRLAPLALEVARRVRAGGDG